MTNTNDAALLRTADTVLRAQKRTSRWLGLAASASLVFSCPISIALGKWLGEIGLHGGVADTIVFLTFAAPLVLALVAKVASFPRKHCVGASVDADRALVLEDQKRTRITADQLASGATTGDGAGVVIETKSGDEYTIALRPGESSSWLETLGLGASYKVFHARMHRIFNQLMFWMLGAPTLISLGVWGGTALTDRIATDNALSAYGIIGGFIVSTLFSFWVSLRWMGVKITIGTDGLLVRNGLSTRFFAYADMVSLSRRAAFSASGGELLIQLRDGRTEVVWLDGDTGTNADVLLKRIEEARAAAASVGTSVASELLARRGRSIAEWRESLAQMLNDGAGYREVSLDAVSLLRLLRDAAAPMEQRIAAALALGAKESTREQVRVVASTTVNDRVRVALESAAEGALDESSFEQAIGHTGVRVAVQ